MISREPITSVHMPAILRERKWEPRKMVSNDLERITVSGYGCKSNLGKATFLTVSLQPANLSPSNAVYMVFGLQKRPTLPYTVVRRDVFNFVKAHPKLFAVVSPLVKSFEDWEDLDGFVKKYNKEGVMPGPLVLWFLSYLFDTHCAVFSKGVSKRKAALDVAYKTQAEVDGFQAPIKFLLCPDYHLMPINELTSFELKVRQENEKRKLDALKEKAEKKDPTYTPQEQDSPEETEDTAQEATPPSPPKKRAKASQVARKSTGGKPTVARPVLRARTRAATRGEEVQEVQPAPDSVGDILREWQQLESPPRKATGRKPPRDRSQIPPRTPRKRVPKEPAPPSPPAPTRRTTRPRKKTVAEESLPDDFFDEPVPSSSQGRSRKDKSFGVPQSSIDAAAKRAARKKTKTVGIFLFEYRDTAQG